MRGGNLLGRNVPPAARAYRARWVLALDEAGRLGRPATWEEWNRIWFGRERVTFQTAKRALTRLKRELRLYGVRLEASLEGTVNAQAREVRDLIEPWIRTARDIRERIDALKERRKPELVNGWRAAPLVRSAEVVEAAGSAQETRTEGKQSPPRGYHWLKKRFGISYGRLRYLLSCKKATRDPSRRRTIEDRRSPAVIERALAEFDAGGTVRDVAAVLRCSTRTAWLFLKRHGRSPRNRGNGESSS